MAKCCYVKKTKYVKRGSKYVADGMVRVKEKQRKEKKRLTKRFDIWEG